MGEKEDVQDGIDAATKRIMAGLTFKHEDTPPTGGTVVTAYGGGIDSSIEALQDFIKEMDSFSGEESKQEKQEKMKAAKENLERKLKESSKDADNEDSGDWEKEEAWEEEKDNEKEEDEPPPPPPPTRKKAKEDPCAAKLAAKDEEIERLKQELVFFQKNIEEIADENLTLRVKVAELEDAAFKKKAREGALVPEGETFETYFEQLENKISGFKEFLMDTDYAMHKQSPTGGIHLVCRKCWRLFHKDQSKKARLDGSLHEPTCPLYRALAK